MIHAKLLGGPLDGTWQTVSDDRWDVKVYQRGDALGDVVTLTEHVYKRPENELDYRWPYAGSSTYPSERTE